MEIQDSSKRAEFTKVNDFINRSEGHEIVQIGKANTQGFHNNFYILAPGMLDQLNGKMVLDSEILDAINIYNTGDDVVYSSDDEITADAQGICRVGNICTDESANQITNSKNYNNNATNMMSTTSRPILGNIINASLQNVLSFEIVTMEGDHRVLGVSLG